MQSRLDRSTCLIRKLHGVTGDGDWGLSAKALEDLDEPSDVRVNGFCATLGATDPRPHVAG